MPRKTRKVSKRVRAMWADPESVWGKNPALEKFWGDLSTMKLIVVITKAGSRLVRSPSPKAMAALEADKDVIALLSSNQSQDAYEVYLYPKAKDKSVAYVIKNYKKYFKPIMPGAKMLVPG
jgi:hypothetical protein